MINPVVTRGFHLFGGDLEAGGYLVSRFAGHQMFNDIGDADSMSFQPGLPVEDIRRPGNLLVGSHGLFIKTHGILSNKCAAR
jgi:hypothetical protein